MTQTLAFSRAAPVLIVDASYYVFYRYFATARWWSFQAPAETEVEGPLLEHPPFLAAFQKHMTADVTRLRKRWIKGAPQNMVFAADCPRAHIWRMDVYPDYKGTRGPNQAFNPAAFPTFHSHVATAHGPPIVALPKLEADDVACLLFRKIRALSPDHPVVFISGDHDYLQLKDAHCEIYSLPEKDLWEAGVKKGTHELERKIVMGDASDNIPPVFPKKIVASYLGADDRAAFLAAAGKTEAYERNKTLMDWARIPESLVAAFDAAVEISL